ncbi:hypothetical protein KKB44_05195 [Candidatus Micrarchaeota archaeon]|nr:hypothetical protein [Candidatus Micrarchaeota archaeon]
MIKTVKEFQDDLKTLRNEMYKRGEFADPEVIASWLDRLVISLDKLAVSLDLMAVEIEVMSKCCGSTGAKTSKKKSAKKKVSKKKPAKKKTKKAKKKRRR